MRLLTEHVRDDGTLRRLVAAYRRDRQLEIRVAKAGVLHDRFLTDGKTFFILGASLNGFAKRQSFIVLGGTDLMAATLQFFEREFTAAPPWP